MASGLIALRNVVVILGAFFVSGLVQVLVFIVSVKVSGSPPVDPALDVGSALLTGLICGLLLVGEKRVVWSSIAGGLVGSLTWSATRRYPAPPVATLVAHGAVSFGAGIVAAIACAFIWSRRSRGGSRAAA